MAAKTNGLPPYVPFPNPTTKAQAQADANAIVTHNVGKSNAADKVTQTVGGAAKDVAGAVTGSAAFFGALANPTTWVRVGEVAFGLVLIIVGIDYMTKAGLAAKAGKAALL